MTFIVRAATQADLPGIDRIQSDSSGAVRWPLADYLIYDCLVAVADDCVAAFLVTRSLGAAQAEILNLAVCAGMRRRGIARRLVEEALAARPGEWFLEVRESNATARRFYSAIGFREAGKRPKYYQDNGEAAVVMRLQPCYCHR